MQTLTYTNHTLTWREHSAGDHTFVFINGYSGTQLFWQHELELFKPLGRCITLDLPGHYPAKVPNNYNQLTQELLIELETQAVKQIMGNNLVTLVGHSTGGLAALGVAANLPSQVERVICIAPVVWGPLTGLLGFAHFLLKHRMYSVFQALWGMTQVTPSAFMLGLSFYVHNRLSHWSNETAWNICRYSHPWYKQLNMWNLAMVTNMLSKCDIRSLSLQVTRPLLVIVGDRDPIVPPVQSRWLANHLPNTTLHVFGKIGHIPQIEKHHECAQVMMNWLTAHRVIRG